MGEAKAASRAVKEAGPRLIAVVGPFQSGKTTLLEAMLARAGAITRQGSVREGSSVGDSSPEARAHGMSVEANIADRGIPRRPLHFRRLRRLRRVHARDEQCASRLRRGHRRLRGRSEEDAGAPGDLARDRGHRAAAHPVPQQDRCRDRARPRHARDAAAGLAHAAPAAADPHLEGWHRDRLHRSRAGACLCLSRTRDLHRGRAARRRAPIARRRRASPCSSASPTTTTGSWRS